MTKIEIELHEKLKKFDYVNMLFFTKQKFEPKFEKYLDKLLVRVEIQLPPHNKDESRNALEQKDGNYILYLRFQLHWKNNTNLTSLPSPEEVNSALNFLLEKTLKDFEDSDENLE